MDVVLNSKLDVESHCFAAVLNTGGASVGGRGVVIAGSGFIGTGGMRCPGLV